MTDSIETILYPHLKHDEELLWTGTPEPGFRWRMGEYIVMGVSVGFIGLPLLYFSTGGTAGLWGSFMATGFLLLFFGLFTGWWVRRRSRYALSTKRGFLIFNHPVSGVQIKSYPIKPVMSIVKQGPDPALVYFAKAERIDVQGVAMPIGFALIKDADMVYDLMRSLQKKRR